jgi:hypothetical protein
MGGAQKSERVGREEGGVKYYFLGLRYSFTVRRKQKHGFLTLEVMLIN